MADVRYDYEKQCWIEDGKVAHCGHPTPMAGCYACEHAGEEVDRGRDYDPQEEVDLDLASEEMWD